MISDGEREDELGCQAGCTAEGADLIAPVGAPQFDISAEAKVRIDYVNWRGERAWRTVVPRSLFFGSTEYHKSPQWLLSAYDVDKEANRDFALMDIQSWVPLPEGPNEKIKEMRARYEEVRAAQVASREAESGEAPLTPGGHKLERYYNGWRFQFCGLDEDLIPYRYCSKTPGQIEERQRRDEVEAADQSDSLTHQEKAQEIAGLYKHQFDWDYQPLITAISEALSESVQAERDRCTKIASDFMEFYRHEDFTDRERALRVGAAGNIVSAIQNPTE